MSPARVRVVNVALALLIAGSLIDIATGREHWPFSPYAMFAVSAPSRTVSKLILNARDAGLAELVGRGQARGATSHHDDPPLSGRRIGSVQDRRSRIEPIGKLRQGWFVGDGEDDSGVLTASPAPFRGGLRRKSDTPGGDGIGSNRSRKASSSGRGNSLR